jgi:hypothetical protein
LQKILIDENLSPSLEALAHERGYLCAHVNHIGKTGRKDWELKAAILDGDWTFVTNNSIDFRGPYDEPGSAGEYSDIRLHAGLVCLNAPGGLNLELQRRLFGLILDDDDLEEKGDLTNQVMEVDLHRNGKSSFADDSYPARTVRPRNRTVSDLFCARAESLKVQWRHWRIQDDRSLFRAGAGFCLRGRRIRARRRFPSRFVEAARRHPLHAQPGCEQHGSQRRPVRGLLSVHLRRLEEEQSHPRRPGGMERLRQAGP